MWLFVPSCRCDIVSPFPGIFSFFYSEILWSDTFRIVLLGCVFGVTPHLSLLVAQFRFVHSLHFG